MTVFPSGEQNRQPHPPGISCHSSRGKTMNWVPSRRTTCVPLRFTFESAKVSVAVCREAGQECSRQDGTESLNSRPRMDRVSAATRLQTRLARWKIGSTSHEPDVPILRTRFGGQSQDSSPLRVCRLWLFKPRGLGWRVEHFRAGIPLFSLWRTGAARPLCEAGTHRSTSGVGLRVP